MNDDQPRAHMKKPYPGQGKAQIRTEYTDAAVSALQALSKDTHLVVSGMVAQLICNVKIVTMIFCEIYTVLCIPLQKPPYCYGGLKNRVN